jgi:hypothetical protein
MYTGARIGSPHWQCHPVLITEFCKEVMAQRLMLDGLLPRVASIDSSVAPGVTAVLSA